MVIKVSAWKPEVNENATLSTVNIAINDNHRLWPYNLRMIIFEWFIIIEALVISQILRKFKKKNEIQNINLRSFQQSEFYVVNCVLVCLSETQYLHAEID